MTRLGPKALVGLAALGAASAAGQQPQAPSVSFSTYGTLGIVRSDEDRADYLVDAFQSNGPGRTRQSSTAPDTRLGLQMSALITPRVTAVVQVLSQQNYRSSYRPVVEWANVKYQVTPDLSVRAGRVVLPVFMVTDTRRVGYANPWVRPPAELYSMVPVTTNDGVDASYRHAWGSITNTVQVTAGRSDSDFPNSAGFEAGTAKVRNLVAFVDALEHGYATLRLTAGTAKLTIGAQEPFFAAFREFGPEGQAISDRYSVRDRRVDFIGIGASYDPGKWFAMAEWARFDTSSIVGTKSGWYVSAGYRISKVTPYVTFARIQADSPTSDAGLTLSSLPPAVVPTAAFLNAVLNEQLNLLPRQSTLSLGVRWDFARNAALKLQYDRVDVAAGSRGMFGNVGPGFQPGGKANLFNLTLDFVY
ncbi:MAG TPA: porin [Usitatibacter sp.]|nr:porin [Usitatibacter sp.]